MSEVGILIIDNDVVSQRALKHVLDAEGWRVRIVPTASHALPELANGTWNLAIVNIALVDTKGPLFAILRDLVQADEQKDANARDEQEGQGSAGEEAGAVKTDPRAEAEVAVTELSRPRFRVLFLVPMAEAPNVEPILEQEGLPYSLKPYHLHEFLEKVSELLVESGSMEQSLLGIGEFKRVKTRKRARSARDSRRNSMFASREDYQMTEEEMTDWERQEEEERKKREKEVQDRGYGY